MSMSVSIPSELQPFIEQELAAGKSRDESELVTAALQLYREMNTRHAELRSQIQRSLDQADRGEVSSLDMDSIKGTLRDELDGSGQPR
ncbi:MAG: type II toxin-antitoxin system ParD family antitoxin [Pirellulaceae bacterium]